MSIRSEVFGLLDKNMEPVEIMEQLNIDANTMATYKHQWKKERGIKSNPAKSADELADKILGDFDKKNETPKKHFVSKEQKQSKSQLQLVARTYKGKYGDYIVEDGAVTINFTQNLAAYNEPSLVALIEELNELRGMI